MFCCKGRLALIFFTYMTYFRRNAGDVSSGRANPIINYKFQQYAPVRVGGVGL